MNKDGKNIKAEMRKSASSALFFVVLFFFFFIIAENIPVKKFVVNTRNKKIHTLDCLHSKKIDGPYRKYYSSLRFLDKNEYSPCRVCNPDNSNN